jgi:hypothetical protein
MVGSCETGPHLHDENLDMNALGFKIRLKAAGREFLRPGPVMSAADREGKKKLFQVGSLAMTIARRSLKNKRDATEAQFPEQLRALIAENKTVPAAQGRDSSGRFVAGAQATRTASLREIIKPWPQTSAMPGQTPHVTVVRTKTGRAFKPFKNMIVYQVEMDRRSVIIGPEVNNGRDVPGILESGGTSTQVNRLWTALKIDGITQYRLVKHGKIATRRQAFPYIAPAFDKTMDKLVPKIFKDIF